MHLRFTLEHHDNPPLTIHYGSKTEIWTRTEPPIAIQRGACDAKVMPIYSPRDCAGCIIRRHVVKAEPAAQGHTADAQTTALRPTSTRSANHALGKNVKRSRTVPARAGTNIIAFGSTARPPADVDEAVEAVQAEGLSEVAACGVAGGSEKRVGWTD
jgi:hypothetical protein